MSKQKLSVILSLRNGWKCLWLLTSDRMGTFIYIKSKTDMSEAHWWDIKVMQVHSLTAVLKSMTVLHMKV